jgi:hypothetical protein
VTGQPRVVVTVNPDGSVSAETRGVLGEDCLDYVAVLEELLAARTVHSAYTADRDRVPTVVAEEQHDVDRT